MGTYRLFLAMLVAMSHMGVVVAGLNPGVVAVISFFLISGFVMTGLVRHHYLAPGLVPRFYLDRAARIFPQYFLFMSLTWLALVLLKFQSPYLAQPSAMAFWANLTIVPLDFFMYSPAVANYMLVPQAWSLGLELLFYLLMPWLLLGRLRSWATVASLLVWLAAAFGLIHTDNWGYRLLPGTLFMFLAGSYLYDHPRLFKRHPVVWLVVALLACGLALVALGKHVLPYNREVLGGLLLGIVMLAWLARVERTRLDDWMGNLSYGVFLCHFLVMWLFEAALGPLGQQPSPVTTIAAMLAACVVLAWLGFVLVERPVLRWRHRLRRRQPA